MKTITIITPVYNGAAHIAGTIESVGRQDYPAIEHIVVDGRSTDGTLDIIHAARAALPAKAGHRFILHSEKDHGLYDAMNRGIELASGDYIGFLHADDYLNSPEVVSTIATALERSGADCLFGDLTIVDPHHTDRVIRRFSSAGFHPGWFAFGLMPAHPTFYMKRELYLTHGGYSLDYQIAADFELLARYFTRHHISWHYLADNLVTMRAGGLSSRSVASRLQINREAVRACRANGISTNRFKIMLKYFRRVMEYL